jgi:pimeloyl-ACP methyl ester carboxylesterase
VLAGHSFGGLYVLSFAAQFPDQVAGMVLLDSTAPKPGPAPPTNTESYNVFGRVSALLPAVAHLGAGRLVAQGSYGSLPPRSRDEARANSSTARYLGSFIEEFVEGSASIQQAASLTDLRGKPLIVLTADKGNDDDKWQSKQDHLAALSTNNLHRHVNATHASLVDDEADSAAASQAIHDVVASVRTSHPLAPP